MMFIKLICYKRAMLFIIILHTSVKLSNGQRRTVMDTGFSTPTENGTFLRNNIEQTEADNRINIGDSFFLNRLRQGDSEAVTQLNQLNQAVDTPMTLLHNFFQVFSRPNLRHRNGVFGLLHNLAVARGLLPNSLAVGEDGLPIQDSPRRELSTRTPLLAETEIPSRRNDVNSIFQINGRNEINGRNVIRTSTNSGIVTINNNINNLTNTLTGSEEIHSGEVSGPFSTEIQFQSNTPVKQAGPSLITSTIESDIRLPPVVSDRRFNPNINLRTQDLDVTSNRQRQVIQRNRTNLDRNIQLTATNVIDNGSNVDRQTIIGTQNSQVGGRFSSPSVRVQSPDQFSDKASEQRGARIFSNNLEFIMNNRTIQNTTVQNMFNNRNNVTRATTSSDQLSNKRAQLKRPSKLNFMLEMPAGVVIAGRMGMVKSKEIISNSDRMNTINPGSRSEIETVQQQQVSKIPGSKSKENDIVPIIESKNVTEKRNISQNILQTLNISEEIRNEYILQRVGHIQLDPTDHVLQVVGEMNLSLAEPEFNIQRVGELNIGRRRQFIMDVSVNSSSAEDKILLQRVGSTDLVPGEWFQLHGSGDVRLLTKERVVIQRLGFISFHTDPLEVNEENRTRAQQSNTSDEIKSIFRIEPVVNDNQKPSLLFLGSETGTVINEDSNSTVLQFVGDVLSEMPLDRLNFSHDNISRFAQNIFISATRNSNDRPVLHNQQIPSAFSTAEHVIRNAANETITPVLRENIALKSKQSRIRSSNHLPVRIHLKSIGRIFSAAELKYENTNENHRLL